MSTFKQIFYHIIFSTKYRQGVLLKDKRNEFYRYIWGILKNRNCHLYRIGGTDDHVHILISLHPSVSLANLVKDIKVGSSKWIKENNIFPEFSYWQNGYGAFTHSIKDKNFLIEYIKNQEEHHKTMSFKDELRELLIKSGIKFDPKYLS